MLVGATVGGLYLSVVGLTLGRRSATLVEAELAAVTVGVNRADPYARWPDAIAARQLGVLERVLDPGEMAALLDSARVAGLLLVFAASLLIFVIVRQLQFRRALAAAAAVGSAIAGGLIQLYAGLNTGPVALLWLAIAVVLALSGVRHTRLAAVAAAGLGVLSMPLAAVGLLVFAGHLIAVSAMAPGLSARARRWSVASFMAGALVVALLATGDRPLAQAPSMIGLALGVPLVGCSALIIGFAWRRSDWLRPVGTTAAALLACGLVPGTGLAAAAQLAAPLIIVLGVALLDAIRPRLPGPIVLTAVAVVGLLAAASAIGLQPGWRSQTAAATSLSGWVATQVDPARVVYTDDLTGAQLVRDGFPASRVRSISEPAPPDAVIVLTDYSGSSALELGTGSTLLARFADGPGHAITEVRLPGGVRLDDARRADQANRLRFGTALSANGSVSWAPDAAASLRGGQVDPRLMTVLAGLAAMHRITVTDIPAVDVEPPEAARRTAVITTYDGAAASDPATAGALAQWFDYQLPPYRPAIQALPGQPVRVSFFAPTPIGLLAN